MEPIVAHLFIFYFAVMSAITPPIAIAAFATAGLAETPAMRTAVEAFKLGLAAFIVPFAFVYSPTLLMQGSSIEIGISVLTALVGIFLLASAVQGWLLGSAGWPVRIVAGAAAVTMIEGSLLFDLIGGLLALGVVLYQRRLAPRHRPAIAPRKAR